MTTVTAVKRALEEAAAKLGGLLSWAASATAMSCASWRQTPAVVTVIADRLSDRGEVTVGLSRQSDILAEQGVVLATLQHGGNLSPEGVMVEARYPKPSR